MKFLKKLIPKDSFYLVLFTCISVLGASALWVSKEKIDVSEKPEVKQEIIEEQEVVEEEINLDLNEDEISKAIKENENSSLEVVPPKEDVVELEKPAEKVEVKPEAKVEPKVELNKEPKVETQVQPKKEEVQKEVAQSEPTEKAKEVPKPQVKAQDPEVSQTESVTSKSVEVKNIKLRKPVEGKIYKDFSQDKLVYSKTLDEWSTHLAIDIAANEGANVIAPVDGIVKQVITDERLGITIILDHGNGLETLYKNISTDKLVKVGQKVKTGDIISKVSKGVGIEKLDEPHLHFEVLKSGVNVDPKTFF